ncbi:MAG: hypothetical protein AAGD14_04195 [Planctomycetota bacterium]
MRLVFGLLLVTASVLGAARVGDPAKGYRHLTEKAYLQPDFDQETFDAVWQVWPEPLRTQAEKASPDERRRMAFERYGLTDRGDGKPLQYVVTEDGGWVMNCFACHGGQVAGRSMPGLPNSNFAMESLAIDMRKTKLKLGKTLSRIDVGQLFIPYGTTHGTTNAVVFSIALADLRDKDLNVLKRPSRPFLKHHDLDAPPWWHFKRRPQLYIDGLVEKGHRSLMQFLMVPKNDAAQFREWEQDFVDVAAYLSSIEAPKWPWDVDTKLVEEGRKVYRANCAECHGTETRYPNRMVPLDDIGTDPVRLKAISQEQRKRFSENWFSHYGKKKVTLEPDGYIAPPLDGIWASAPYFHNGSVPTLWHVLHPEQRPVVWRRSYDGYDREKVGLEVETFEEVPEDARHHWDKRSYFDTRAHSKSAKGHDYPSLLSAAERRALLEYLKTR